MVSVEGGFLCQHGRAVHPDNLVRTLFLLEHLRGEISVHTPGFGGSPPV